jgi:hypothetical protein
MLDLAPDGEAQSIDVETALGTAEPAAKPAAEG